MRTSLSRGDVELAVRAATLAPSVLNTQPWQFVSRDGVIELRRDPGRALAAVDPYHRAATISCGAALFNMLVAIGAMGRRPEIRLLPRGPRSMVLASVAAGDEAPPDFMSRRLHPVMSKRRTSRVPFADEPVPSDVVVRLEEGAEVEGATFRVFDAHAAVDVAHLVHEANLAQRDDSELRAEIARWVGRGPDAVDGIPSSALGPLALDSLSLVRDFAMGEPVEGRTSAQFERHPTIGILLTRDDDALAWVEAGLALERVWLEATAAGLAVSLLTQPFEVSILRWLARPLIAQARQLERTGPDDADARVEGGTQESSWPQALLRIGVGAGQTPPTPRRPLSDVLTFA